MASSATDFSAPVYLDEPAADSQEALGNAEPAVDLNDPALLEAEVSFDEGKDPYEIPPPVSDGFYRVKAKQIIKGEKSYTLKSGKKGPYAYAALELVIQQPGGMYDGNKVSDYFVSTMQARNGGVPIIHILNRCLGVKIPAGVKIAALMELFQKALAGEPDMVVELAWEANLSEDDQKRFEAANVKQPFVRGMHNFPDKLDEKGKVVGKNPDITKDTSLGKVSLRARPRVMGYFLKDHPVTVVKK